MDPSVPITEEQILERALSDLGELLAPEIVIEPYNVVQSPGGVSAPRAAAVDALVIDCTRV
jgi:hypothetical protein